jgi:hypothetical protein
MKQNKEYRKQHHIDNREYDLVMNKKWYKNNREKINIRTKKYNHTLKGNFIRYKTGAKRRGLIFELTLDEFSKIINKPCYYCGSEGYGIDRLDSSIGYLKSNIVPCCSMCNYMKNNYSEEDFVNQCIKISNNKERG